MFASTLLPLLHLPLELIAQAGGGGNFGGGGGGSGGGGGGGGEGGGYLIYLLFRFTVRYPQYGIPLCIVIAVAVYYGKKAESDFRITRTIRRGRKVQEESLRESVIGRIQQRDPQFDTETFLQRVVNGFVTVQYAWSDQDLRRCRAFISDGVRERFELYIAMQQAENIRNRMRQVEVTGTEVVSVTSDSHFDTIHVRIGASAISYNEDLTSSRRVSGNSDRTPISFAEIWSFSRRPGVQTQTAASVMEGRCPNCGGPVEIVDKAECPQCRSVVNSGQYDWVLAEITQDEEWVVPPVQHSVDGWQELQQQDPGLNFQHIEDRASVIFWRCLMSVYFEDFSYAAPVLDRQATAVPELWAPERKVFWKTPAVGVVEVVQCVPAQADEFDRILILVRWSGTKAQGHRLKPMSVGIQRIYSHVLTLKRRQGTLSQVEKTFSSSGCSNCGAPINPGAASTCGFCGTPLNDGAGDWILEDVGPHNMIESLRREDRRESQLNGQQQPERLKADRLLNEPELLTALSRILTVDGELHDKERRHLIQLARSRGVSEDRLKTIFATATSKDMPIIVPQDLRQANVFMDHLLRAALVDGRVTRSEHQLLLKASQQIGWSAADLKIALARNRRELYQQAKQIIRNRRRG